MIFCSPLFDDGDDDVLDFLFELNYGFPKPSAPGLHSIPQDHAIAPSTTHTAALAISGENTGIAVNFGERGLLKVGLSAAAN